MGFGRGGGKGEIQVERASDLYGCGLWLRPMCVCIIVLGARLDDLVQHWLISIRNESRSTSGLPLARVQAKHYANSKSIHRLEAKHQNDSWHNNH